MFPRQGMELEGQVQGSARVQVLEAISKIGGQLTDWLLERHMLLKGLRPARLISHANFNFVSKIHSKPYFPQNNLRTKHEFLIVPLQNKQQCIGIVKVGVSTADQEEVHQRIATTTKTEHKRA